MRRENGVKPRVTLKSLVMTKGIDATKSPCNDSAEKQRHTRSNRAITNRRPADGSVFESLAMYRSDAETAGRWQMRRCHRGGRDNGWTTGKWSGCALTDHRTCPGCAYGQ